MRRTHMMGSSESNSMHRQMKRPLSRGSQAPDVDFVDVCALAPVRVAIRRGCALAEIVQSCSFRDLLTESSASRHFGSRGFEEHPMRFALQWGISLY